jgi:hypothetical protein
MVNLGAFMPELIIHTSFLALGILHQLRSVLRKEPEFHHEVQRTYNLIRELVEEITSHITSFRVHPNNQFSTTFQVIQ